MTGTKQRIVTWPLLIAVLVLGCSKRESTSPVCERARDQALENHKHHVAAVMADVPENARAELQDQAGREVTRLRARFVGACEATADFKPECFASPEIEQSPRCRQFIERFARRTLR